MSVKQITTGQDSFLDIVANLVGILIILVVVIGAQATAVWQTPEPKVELVEKIQFLEIENSRIADVVEKLQTDNEQLEDRIIKENQLAANLTDQRHQMLMQLEIIKRQMKKEKDRREGQIAAIDAKERENIQKRHDFIEKKTLLERELVELVRETNAVTASQPKSDVINHFPNPIAKTVFSEEVHFRLANGKLAYVPMEELITRMKSEWKVKAEKLRQANRTIETVGPINSFRMQYELAADVLKQNTKYGVAESKTVRFKQFHIHPLSGELGESVENALADGSEFQEILQRHEPRKTTVSIWVYPDSFGEHNEIKNWLHENGFQMASWPLQTGKKISGGPQGFKTSAQ